MKRERDSELSGERGGLGFCEEGKAVKATFLSLTLILLVRVQKLKEMLPLTDQFDLCWKYHTHLPLLPCPHHLCHASAALGSPGS